METGEGARIKSIIRSMLEAYNKKDLATMLSFFADDASYIRSEGTFKGKEEIKRYYTWNYSNNSEVSLIEKAIVVEGDMAALEWAFEGTFRGKEEIKRYYTWSYSNYSEVSLEEKGIVVEGDWAVLEWSLEGTSIRGGGKRAQLQGLDLFRFKNEKVQVVHIYQDRLLIAKQLASGWFEKTIINAVVKRMEKGLVDT